MSTWLSRLTLNQRLALVALVLGAGAVAATPTRTGSVTIAPLELALIVQKGADHLSARDLAGRLIAGRADLRIIDLRDESAYLAYHIPSAENIPIAALQSAEIAHNESLLVYGDDGAHAAQAWFLLKARGFRGAYMLRGGLAEWREQVLFPVLPEATTPDRQRENERLARVAAHFGGAPRAATGGEPALAMPAAPRVEVPAPRIDGPAGAAGARPAPRRKEGC